ncbi:MAG: hypothetical protein J6I66_01745 [Lachnospiraceae bacterium]|nr:hypothetical protein [Lachnospiraceae bacterium]
MKDYDQIYKDLGIAIVPLSDNYDPEIYGRELMRGLNSNEEISYSSATNYAPKTLLTEKEDSKLTFV